MNLPQNLRAQAEKVADEFRKNHYGTSTEDCFLAGASWLYQTLVQMPEGFKEFWIGQKYQFNGHGAEKVWFASPSKASLDEYRAGNKINEAIHTIDIAALAQLQALHGDTLELVNDDYKKRIHELKSELTTKDQRIKELEEALKKAETHLEKAIQKLPTQPLRYEFRESYRQALKETK